MSDTDGLNHEYLQPTEMIDSDNEEVIAFSREVAGEATDPVERARRLFYAVRDGIVYDLRSPFFLPKHYTASNVLRRRRGYCVSKACLLCATCRAMGIPARLGLADIINRGVSKQVVDLMGTNIFTYHGFGELLLNGRWVKATCAFDKPIFQRHNVAPVEFDGVHDAVYPSHNLAGEPYVEYVTYHGSFADVPLEALLASWDRHYGRDRVALWRRYFEESERMASEGYEEVTV